MLVLIISKNLSDLKKGDTNKGQILMDDIGKIDRDWFSFYFRDK